MSELKLELRYPESRQEDITDAFMRGYETGFKQRECRMDYLCDGYLYFKSYWCRVCDERFAYRLIGNADTLPKYCPTAVGR